MNMLFGDAPISFRRFLEDTSISFDKYIKEVSYREHLYYVGGKFTLELEKLEPPKTAVVHLSADFYFQTRDKRWAVKKKTGKIDSSQFSNWDTDPEISELRNTGKMELSIELYGDNIVQWNDQLSPSPNSQEVAYISNRDQIDSGGASLYVMDIATGQETMLTENNSYYSICGWLNDDYLVCDKYSSNTHKIVAISTNGLEITVPTSGSDPWVYAVHDGLIAYAPQLGSNQITILKFNEITGEVFETDTIIMGAETRLRAGNYGFSPDGQKFICLCVPEDNPENRFVGIYNIVDKNYDELYAPGTSDYIQSVDWIDDTSLLVVTGDSEDRLTTWTYELK